MDDKKCRQITHAVLAQEGGAALSEPFKIRTGRTVEFHDPSGNVIGITDYDDKK
jgi:predicted enzyme related to lactoylglutathione lyase